MLNHLVVLGLHPLHGPQVALPELVFVRLVDLAPLIASVVIARAPLFAFFYLPADGTVTALIAGVVPGARDTQTLYQLVLGSTSVRLRPGRFFILFRSKCWILVKGSLFVPAQ
jgi:hypothetical protein